MIITVKEAITDPLLSLSHLRPLKEAEKLIGWKGQSKESMVISRELEKLSGETLPNENWLAMT